MSKQPTVADYIVGRLAREGITDCFGVAGDFAFMLNDAVARSQRIRWIGYSENVDRRLTTVPDLFTVGLVARYISRKLRKSENASMTAAGTISVPSNGSSVHRGQLRL